MGWLALTLSTIIILSIGALISSWRASLLASMLQFSEVPTGIILIWLSTIAALYHLETLVERTTKFSRSRLKLQCQNLAL